MSMGGNKRNKESICSFIKKPGAVKSDMFCIIWLFSKHPFAWKINCDICVQEHVKSTHLHIQVTTIQRWLNIYKIVLLILD